jgi:hypothetical protein
MSFIRISAEYYEEEEEEKKVAEECLCAVLTQ